jgi:hypothetical protein
VPTLFLVLPPTDAVAGSLARAGRFNATVSRLIGDTMFLVGEPSHVVVDADG